MKIKSSLISVLSLALVSLVLTGCPPKKKLDIQEKPQAEETPTPTTDEVTGPSDVQISQEWAEIPMLASITFDFDSASLNDGQRAVLKTNVAVLKKLPTSVAIRVEGHCDDRGTVEYNVALGQRRATAISNFYSSAGLGKSRLKTISFGEERPLCIEQTEDCWARNRRGVTTVRNEQPLSINPENLK